MPLVRSEDPAESDIECLRSTVAELEAALVARAAEIARAQSDLAAFRLRYKQQVGMLHEELDELHRAIADAELDELAKHLLDQAADATAAPAGASAPTTPRFTSDAVRKLFREVAKAIHPDLAPDDVTRDRRHRLMVEANRAYELGDEERLRWILDAWENSPEAIQGNDPDAVRQRLHRRIMQLEGELAATADELATMADTPLWKLKVMVDEAWAKGKDLMGEMVRRLKRDILVARNRLDAIRWVP